MPRRSLRQPKGSVPSAEFDKSCPELLAKRCRSQRPHASRAKGRTAHDPQSTAVERSDTSKRGERFLCHQLRRHHDRGNVPSGHQFPASMDEIPQKLRRRSCATYHQMIPSTSASHIKQMPLGVVHILKLCLVRYCFQPFLQRQNIIVTGHNATARNSSPLARCIVLIDSFPAALSKA